jgi:gamma-glutamyltranspeptidase/glutathione hydrolase
MEPISRRELLAGAAGMSFLAGCGSAEKKPPPPPDAPGCVVARGGVVASSQKLATEVGISILKAGGNAADAAVATAAALNVTEPMSTGIGGDMFALFYDAKTRKISALNSSGRAPAALSIELLRRQNLIPLPPHNANCVTVPGACAGWCDLVARHGTMPLEKVLAPAIRLAEEGFPVGPMTASGWQGSMGLLRRAPGGLELTIDGRAPRAGETFRNPGLAKTFKAVGAGGKDAYYKGDIGRAVAEAVRKSGGVMEAADLAAHEATWDEPASTVYRGLRVWECPPNGQGITVLIALNLLEGFDLGKMDPLGPERWHLMIEAIRLAFADTRWYVADPKFSKVPVKGLLDKAYAAERRKLIDPAKAAADPKRGSPVAGSDTVYFCVVDRDGNACSFINSNYMGFGTAIVPSGWGFTLQNRGHNFMLEEGHPNALAPGKRPYHTIIPGMLTREADGSLYAPFGVMGGFMQPQGHLQTVVSLADDGALPQAALDRPRFYVQPDGDVLLEEGLPGRTAVELGQRGHPVKPGPGGYGRSIFGRGQIIRRDPDGWLVAGSDLRADGGAMGLP